MGSAGPSPCNDSSQRLSRSRSPVTTRAVERSRSADASLHRQGSGRCPLLLRSASAGATAQTRAVTLHRTASTRLQHACRSSQQSFGSSSLSYTTRSSTPTSILEPPTTQRKRLTPFTVYDAQPQSFKNPLFGTKGSPSPQMAAYAKHADPSHITLESPACASVTRDHVPGQNDVMTPVANLSSNIDAAADNAEHVQVVHTVEANQTNKV